MQIAPGVNASEWHALSLDDPNSADWDKAVGILAARIRDRYLEPVDFLIERTIDVRLVVGVIREDARPVRLIRWRGAERRVRAERREEHEERRTSRLVELVLIDPRE